MVWQLYTCVHSSPYRYPLISSSGLVQSLFLLTHFQTTGGWPIQSFWCCHAFVRDCFADHSTMSSTFSRSLQTLPPPCVCNYFFETRSYFLQSTIVPKGIQSLNLAHTILHFLRFRIAKFYHSSRFCWIDYGVCSSLCCLLLPWISDFLWKPRNILPLCVVRQLHI